MRRTVLALVLIGSVGTTFAPTLARGSLTLASSPTVTPVPGTPGPATTPPFLGRYRVFLSSSAKLAHRGQLTLFMRVVAGQPAPLLSGILALSGAHVSNVFYLTQFTSKGDTYAAVVNAGIYTGPVIGSFTIDMLCHNRMDAVLVVRKRTKIDLDFVRFSTNPHP